MKNSQLMSSSSTIDRTPFPPDTRVTMHVVSPVRNDGRILREATALQAEGLVVSIVDIEAQDTCPAKEDIQGLHVKHVLMSREFAETRFTKHRAFRALLIFIRSILCLIKMPTDIYHAHDTIALPACAIAALVRRKPLIFDAHELPLAGLHVNQTWLNNLVIRMLTYIVRRCVGVITVSAPIAEEICRRYKAQQVTVVRNTLSYQVTTRNDRLRQYLDLETKIHIVLYQGNIQEDRRLDILVRATTFLEHDIVVVLMGQDMGNTVAELKALALREGVANRVRFVPPVPYKELLAWTASADLGLIIYSPDYSLNVKMCLPNKLFEYLMAGLPILASSLDAVAELIKTYDVGQIVPSLAPYDIATAINSMVADRDTLALMRLNALNASQIDLHWEKESQQLIRLYEDILIRRKKPR